MTATVSTVQTKSSVIITTTEEECQSPQTLELLQRRISISTYTPFQKAVWIATLQIPAGSVSTYAILSRHLRSSPRAVGNALRRNPFAPHVPCHRVVAADSTLGGFKGKIARRDGEGITLVEKRTLLRKEGVKFDPKGRVLGTPFARFT